MVKIKLAEDLGYCFGVERAVASVMKEKGEVKTLGMLIHNKKLVNRLEKRGIKAVKSLDEVKGGKLAIRTHGVPSSTIKQAKRKGLNVIDLTCPFVKKLQYIAQELSKKGFFIVILGEHKHPEIVGVVDGLKDYKVISELKETAKIKTEKNIALIAQTTQSHNLFHKVEKELKSRFKNVVVFNTICNATSQRQDAAVKLARESDLMIVVGDRQSANTNRLASLCSKVTKTILVEDAGEIDKSVVKDKNSIGISSGASTPMWVVDEVIKKIESKENSFEKVIERKREIVNKELASVFASRSGNKHMNFIYDSIKSYLESGGKRLRPIMLLMSYKAFGGKKDISKAALSVELLHNSTLVHDDVMDEDDFRRGKITFHKRVMNKYKIQGGSKLFSSAQSRFAVTDAICAGNILTTLGLQLLLSAPVNERMLNEAVEIYLKAYNDVNEGQLLDVFSEVDKKIEEKDYLHMIDMKTGALFRACFEIGAVLAGAERKRIEAISKYSFYLSRAFQIFDDIMDLSIIKGHDIGSDIKQGKKTLIMIKALDSSNKLEKKIIMKAFGNARVGKKDLEKAIDALYTTGAVEYATIEAKRYIAQAKIWLKKARVNDSLFFENLVDYTIMRLS